MAQFSSCLERRSSPVSDPLENLPHLVRDSLQPENDGDPPWATAPWEPVPLLHELVEIMRPRELEFWREGGSTLKDREVFLAAVEARWTRWREALLQKDPESKPTRFLEPGEYPTGNVAHTATPIYPPQEPGFVPHPPQEEWPEPGSLNTAMRNFGETAYRMALAMSPAQAEPSAEEPEPPKSEAPPPDTTTIIRPSSASDEVQNLPETDKPLPQRALNRYWVFRKLMEHPRWSGGGGLILSLIIAKQALDYEIDGAIKTAAFVFLLAWGALVLAVYISTFWDKHRPWMIALSTVSAVVFFFVWWAYLPLPPDTTRVVPTLSAASSQTSPPLSPSTAQNEQRVFTDITPEQLIGFYKKYNSAQADQIVKTYIGQPLKASGVVYDVERIGDDVRMLLMVKGMSGWTHYAISARFDDQRWKDRAVVFDKGETVTVAGRILGVSETSVLLEHCEIIE